MPEYMDSSKYRRMASYLLLSVGRARNGSCSLDMSAFIFPRRGLLLISAGIPPCYNNMYFTIGGSVCWEIFNGALY